MNDLKSFMKEKMDMVEQGLKNYLSIAGVPEPLAESMTYSVDAGGKRLRPILVLATMEALGKPSTPGLPVACSIEMLHTYSLIHDDLPAMDNDDYRRGKLTNHKVFGEAIAILAGDGLLTLAFETICKVNDESVSHGQLLQIVRELAVFAGPQGMVGGQVADLAGENQQLGLSELQFIHQHKTADLLMFCVRAGGILAGAKDDQMGHLTRFAQNIGLAFQIQDDILDVLGDEEKLGKPVGSDEKLNKATYPALLGMDQSCQLLDNHIQTALQALEEADLVDSSVLVSLAHFIQKRDH